MRIGIDYRTALVNREGIGRYARELVRGLVDLGHDEDLGLFGWTLAPMKLSRAELGIEGTRARMTRFRFPSRWMPDLFRALGKGADDLVGGVEVFHHTQPHLLPVRRAVEVATVFDCIYARGGPWLSPEAAEAMTNGVRAMIARAKVVLVPTEFVARDVERTFGVPRDRIAVTLLGGDHVLRGQPRNGSRGDTATGGSRSSPNSLPNRDLDAASSEREPYLLTVARVDPRKNHARMLAAFEQIRREGFPHRWIISGPRGHGAEEFEAVLASSSARAHVEWIPFASDDDLRALYSGASAFLFASLEEGFGLPPVEALHCGAPVVSSSTSCMPEVLADAALLVDPLSSDAIFEATRAILRSPELARDLVRRGHARAAQLTWRACAQATRKAYLGALAR